MTNLRWKRSIIYATLAVVSAFMVLPVVWAACSSLKSLEGVYRFPPSFLPEAPIWSNYSEVFVRLPLLRFIANSVFITTVSVIGAVLTSSMAGFVLARGSLRTRKWLFGGLIVSMMLPAPLLLVPRFMMYDMLGWIDTYKPLIVPAWLGGGAFNIFLFRQFFRAIPKELDDAATLDGAGMWHRYRYIFMPIARPAVVTAALLSFVFHWQEFLDPLIYLSDFHTYPIALGLRMYHSMAGTWANLLMAASLVALLPVVVVYLICDRHLMRGLGVIGQGRR